MRYPGRDELLEGLKNDEVSVFFFPLLLLLLSLLLLLIVCLVFCLFVFFSFLLV